MGALFTKRARRVLNEALASLGDGRELREAGASKVQSAFQTAMRSAIDTLTAKGEKYGAKLAIDVRPEGVRVRIWLSEPVNRNIDEAQEIAEIFLGSGVKVEPHVLKKGVWFAMKIYKAAELFPG